MKSPSSFRVLDERESSSRHINRRQWIARMLGGVTAGVALPGLESSHPVHKHLASPSTLDKADAQVAATDWTPEFLDPHQIATLDILAERIVPGSSRAQSARFIDTLLAVEPRDGQQRFLNSLAAIESISLQKYGHSYKDLTESQQNDVLTAASTAQSGHTEHRGRRRRAALPTPAPGAAQENDTLRDHFENLKGWVLGAYYSSEIGMRELGWTGEVMFESFPGCEHPGGHA